jgi:hypothetical protein
LSTTSFNKTLDNLDDGRAIGATISQIADKDKASAIRVYSMFTITEMTEQIFQRIDFTMNVTNDVDGAVEEWLNKLSQEKASLLPLSELLTDNLSSKYQPSISRQPSKIITIASVSSSQYFSRPACICSR